MESAPTKAPAVKTTCPYCGVGCGVLARVGAADETVSISGDPDHPANYGRLCSKGSALHETLSTGGRLFTPMVDGAAVSWPAALNRVAQRFNQCIREHGPDSVAFYVSGQLLTEDYYVANKLMKGFIGSANIDTNSRLCMASSVAGHKRAFGTDTVPGCYEDLELADLVVLVGSNLAWCHPVLYQRLAAAKDQRPDLKVVVIDPRRTATCDIADHHLAIAPGSDVALFNGLLSYLGDHGATDQDYVTEHTTGFETALETARDLDFQQISRITDLSGDELSAFFELFAKTHRVVTVYSQGVNQSSSGTDKVNAIINCHLLTGRIGRPGTGPFSVTGQPNAMGGREVGGLANQLASHLELENAEHRSALKSFWNAPTMAHKPGLKAVEMFDAVASGDIKAIWIMATNPVDSLPEADAVRGALHWCPFVVVSDVVADTDTTAFADVLLPAAAWGEKDGTVTNSERRISRQRRFLPLPGDAKPDWWIISEVAKRMGHGHAFWYDGPHDIFEEYVRSTSLSNCGTRDLDLSGLSNLDIEGYASSQPVMWPVTQVTGMPERKRFFADGNFFTPDGKARFVATRFAPPKSTPSKRYPLVLNSGRVRDQWHTMTRTAKSPRLMGHIGEPFVELHPDDAKKLGIEPASLVEIESPHGRVVLRALITERQRRGSVFAPMHWTDQFAANARINALVPPMRDPLSGQPESKFTPVSVRPWTATWYGFAVLAQKPAAVPCDYWAMSKTPSGWGLELAGTRDEDDWKAFAQQLFAQQGGEGTAPESCELFVYGDNEQKHHRFLNFYGDRLQGALFVAPEPVQVSRVWATDLPAHTYPSTHQKLQLLAARAGADQPDRGAIVCSCFTVGVNQIAEAVRNKECATVDEIGKVTQAGTNCGSCRPEIRRIIDETVVFEAS